MKKLILQLFSLAAVQKCLEMTYQLLKILLTRQLSINTLSCHNKLIWLQCRSYIRRFLIANLMVREKHVFLLCLRDLRKFCVSCKFSSGLLVTCNFRSNSDMLSSFQIDIAPTLALLYGVPIPKNNVGVVTAECLWPLTGNYCTSYWKPFNVYKFLYLVFLNRWWTVEGT